MSTKGDDADLRALLDRIDRETAETERDELKEHQRELERQLAVMNARLEQLVETGKPKLVRSAMTAMEKSQFLRKFGPDAYWRIPWA
jgi:hypothetical protein